MQAFTSAELGVLLEVAAESFAAVPERFLSINATGAGAAAAAATAATHPAATPTTVSSSAVLLGGGGGGGAAELLLNERANQPTLERTNQPTLDCTTAAEVLPAFERVIVAMLGQGYVTSGMSYEACGGKGRGIEVG
jgi:hypothetical protein